MNLSRRPLARLASPQGGSGRSAAGDVRRVHGPFFCTDGLVKASKEPSSESRQGEIPLAFGVHRTPVRAPAEVVRQARDTAHALQIAMKAAKVKGAVVAKVAGISEPYVSLLRSGARPITEALVGRLCIATQSQLVAQVFAREEAERDNAAAQTLRLVALLRSASA